MSVSDTEALRSKRSETYPVPGNRENTLIHVSESLESGGREIDRVLSLASRAKIGYLGLGSSTRVGVGDLDHLSTLATSRVRRVAEGDDVVGVGSVVTASA
jgi:hypothetical protein